MKPQHFSKEVNILDKLPRRTIRSTIRDLCPNWLWRLCKNIRFLIVWFPIIWKDRDWDHAYLLRIINFKLKRMERFFRTKSIIMDRDVVADQMKECQVLINRILEDDYHEEPYTKENLAKGDRERQEDLKQLFENFRENILGWWD